MTKGPARHDLAPWPVTVWAASTPAQLRRISKALGTDEGLTPSHAGWVRSVTAPDLNGLQLVVWIDPDVSPEPLELVDTCAHEASHAVDGLFEYVEEERPGTETRAYLVGWLTRWLLTHCAPQISGSTAQQKDAP